MASTMTPSHSDHRSRGDSHPHTLVGTLIGAAAGIAIAYAVAKEAEHEEQHEHGHRSRHADRSSYDSHTYSSNGHRTGAAPTRRSRHTSDASSGSSRHSRERPEVIEPPPSYSEYARSSARRSTPLALPPPPTSPSTARSHQQYITTTSPRSTAPSVRPLTAANLSRVPAKHDRSIVDDLQTIAPSDSISCASSKAERTRRERTRRSDDDSRRSRRR